MSQDLSQALVKPEKKKETQYNLIATISDDMNKWYGALKNTIAGGGNKKDHLPGTKSQDILSGNQITAQWEKWWQQWIERRWPRTAS